MYTSFDGTTFDKIITLLKSHHSEFVSGEKLGRMLSLSRTAIWKNIKKLQSLGYKIESKPKIGYRLHANTGLFLPWEITDGLQTDIIGKKIYYFDKIDSTQNFALDLTQRPHENGSVVIAQRQTQGRGRLDRRWISPKGGIWMSILLRPNFEPSYASLFPMLTSLALAVSIEEILKIKTELKWPNDLTLKGKKVAGILIDASIESNKIDYIIIGVGINFKIKPDIVTKSIKNNKRNYGITTLIKKNQKGNPVELIQQFLFELEQNYNKVVSDSTGQIRKEWVKRSSTIGKNITTTTTTGILKGKALGIDKTGALLLSNRGKIQRLLAGDIIYKN
ncbi:biotin--[acetyl-CoA-carboxylase] ligase [Candidatus Nitrosotalea okcheonensis]|uniref:Putative biotin/lipoate A/B protein ligase family protein n=1 Tax=Candidatus Nitrosotalea okcheonensis TaxID=1903276 RepID=A0A2H1FE16_9ARCH|nr:biotin--[acetyl-CoA-carboxylase] ligase [Candidatus Nitrosotalea okcheonensis]SMH71022.1 putative biotin/lipoate A/B protein ligase family protein [Candidatus Nitrosotalea okcheonensis]